MKPMFAWAPAVIFALGSVLVMGADRQQHLELRGDLARDVPASLLGTTSEDLEVSDQEVAVAGMDTYLLRSYTSPPGAVSAAGVSDFTLYVGFYGSQAQGRTIHSPKNCMPGSGWEALHSRQVAIPTAMGEVPANRYVLKRGEEQVLVLYWYQGRGRVRANEYLVKLDLLKDSALRGRSDEALVRIVVPIRDSEEEAFEAAAGIAGEIVPTVHTILPA